MIEIFKSSWYSKVEIVGKKFLQRILRGLFIYLEILHNTKLGLIPSFLFALQNEKYTGLQIEKQNPTFKREMTNASLLHKFEYNIP